MKRLSEIPERLAKIYAEARSKAQMQKLAKQAAEQIRKRTRAGYGVDRQGGKRFRLLPLSDEYIDQREIDKKGRLSDKTKPTKSNLTYTGQMLDSIDGKSSSAGKGEVYFKEGRDDGLDNSDIAKYQEEQYRPFFHLTGTEIKQIIRDTRIRITKLVDSYFK